MPENKTRSLTKQEMISIITKWLENCATEDLLHFWDMIGGNNYIIRFTEETKSPFRTPTISEAAVRVARR